MADSPSRFSSNGHRRRGFLWEGRLDPKGPRTVAGGCHHGDVAGHGWLWQELIGALKCGVGRTGVSPDASQIEAD
jgi:hypothetical protein